MNKIETITPEERDPADATLECATCGKNGFPGDICDTCHRPLDQKRQYTLSEERSGRAPDGERYHRTGAVGPKVVKLPGSA